MKKLMFVALAGLIMAATLTSCSKVDQGFEAAKINTLGSDKGEIQVLGQGWQFYNVFKYDLIQNPTFVQEYVWTKSPEEGSKNDESITFQSSNSLPFNADIGISFAIVEGATGRLYQKYHKTVGELVDVNLRNTVRDALNRKASERSAEQIYGTGKVEFINEVYLDVKAYWADYLDIKKIYLIGKLDPPVQVKAAINKKIEATQKAQQRQNEVAESMAQAAKDVAKAQGLKDSQQLITDAAAYDILERAKAKAKAMELVNKQLDASPLYIEYIKATNWDGKLPTWMGGNGPVPMLNVK